MDAPQLFTHYQRSRLITIYSLNTCTLGQPERLTLMDAPEMASDELKRRRRLYASLSMEVPGARRPP